MKMNGKNIQREFMENCIVVLVLVLMHECLSTLLRVALPWSVSLE